MAWRDKLLRRFHLCIGGLLAIPLVMIGLTGSVLVFEQELTAWLDPVPPADASGPSHSLRDIIAAAASVAPPDYVATLVTVPDALGKAAEVRFADKQRGPGPSGLQIFVDPSSLAVLAVHRPSESLLRRIFLLHANLMMQDRSGRSIIGWFGVAMCILGASGLVLWWPARRNWRTGFTIRRGTRGAVLLREIHGAVGIWSLAVFMVVSFTGVWLAFPQTFNGLAASSLGARDLRPGAAGIAVQPQPGVDALDIDAAASLALAEVPESQLDFVALPARADQPLRVALAPASGGALPITVFIDPWRKRIAALRDPRDFTVAERVVGWMHGLHEGRGFGPAWRVLVFISGLLPAFFAGTGLWMWFLKRRRRRRVATDVVAVPGE
jgi:uncharacterized iron-regulated membrane protein